MACRFSGLFLDVQSFGKPSGPKVALQDAVAVLFANDDF
jgi:hypothetical protein